MSSEVAIAVRGLGKTYPMYARPHHRLLELLLGDRGGRWRREHRALGDVGFDVRRGETVGIVGSNGSGKSTLLQLLCGTLEPSEGEVRVQGRIAALLELGAGFDPEFTGRENVFLYGTVLGLTRAEVEQRFDRIAAFADIGEFIDQPVRTYSSGMFVRLAFAVAIHVDPDILVVDEALSVGDEAFQRKCFARIEQLRDAGATVLFVSHASQTVVQLCDRALWLEAGALRMDGAPRDVVAAYHRATLGGGTGATAEHEAADGPAAVALPFAPTLVAYPRDGATLSEPSIASIDGAPAEALERGRRYRFSYSLALDRDAPGARAGMMIRNRAGFELAGANFEVVRLLGRDPVAGDRLRIAFEFDCLLYPGTYFLSCGAMAAGPAGDAYLHRLVDAFEIRVLPELSGQRRRAEPQGAIDLRVDVSAAYAPGAAP
jgi:lipopolysaccharide transport system ATP-binding protein